MKKRLVDANALLQELKIAKEGGMFAAKYIQAHEVYTAESIAYAIFSCAEDVINNAPSVDPVKHGHWICEYDRELGETDITCSVCHDTRTVNGCYVSYKGESLYHDDNFCPYCGAKMDEGASR